MLPRSMQDASAVMGPLFHSVRFASTNVRYPLPVDTDTPWRRGGEPIRVALPDVPADHVIAASFSATAAHPFSFRLLAQGERAETARFGARVRRRESSTGAVAVPVDYFHTRENLRGPVVTLRCSAPHPRAYLVVVAVRPRVIDPPRHLPPDTPAAPAPRLSQTTLAPAERSRACSPTAAAMALGVGTAAGLRDFVRLARHQPTGLYGAWPQNIWAAARRGRLGAVELVSDWPTAQRILRLGSDGDPAPPLVASIRFEAGGLEGSPLPSTEGHLVTVRGVKDGAVIAHDPAAPSARVLRHYEARQFAAAWMARRGAAYVFARQAGGAGS